MSTSFTFASKHHTNKAQKPTMFFLIPIDRIDRYTQQSSHSMDAGSCTYPSLSSFVIGPSAQKQPASRRETQLFLFSLYILYAGTNNLYIHLHAVQFALLSKRERSSAVYSTESLRLLLLPRVAYICCLNRVIINEHRRIGCCSLSAIVLYESHVLSSFIFHRHILWIVGNSSTLFSCIGASYRTAVTTDMVYAPVHPALAV